MKTNVLDPIQALSSRACNQSGAGTTRLSCASEVKGSQKAYCMLCMHCPKCVDNPHTVSCELCRACRSCSRGAQGA